MEYNKNVQINTINGKLYEISMITIEQMFDFGIVGAYDRVYINAILNGTVERFKVIVNIERYLELAEDNIDKDYGDRVKIIKCDTDRNDYLFYLLNYYNVDDGEDGVNNYSNQELLATFLPNSNRKFGYSYFRTIKDIIFYIKTVDSDVENIIWCDDEGNRFSVQDLWDISNSMPINYTLSLSNYNIFDRNEQCVFSKISNID